MVKVMLILSVNNSELLSFYIINPMILYFVLVMVFSSFLCDVVGYFTHQYSLFEVSAWNMLIAAIAISLVVSVENIETTLSQPLNRLILDMYIIIKWVLFGLFVAIATWRLIIRTRNPKKIPIAYLGVVMLIFCLVSFQTYLGIEIENLKVGINH